MIDKNPAVGRYAFVEGTAQGDFIGLVSGRIVKVAGARIVVQGPRGTERYIYKLAAVCDTDEEVARIKDFSRRSSQRVAELHEALTTGWNALIGGSK